MRPSEAGLRRQKQKQGCSRTSDIFFSSPVIKSPKPFPDDGRDRGREKRKKNRRKEAHRKKVKSRFTSVRSLSLRQSSHQSDPQLSNAEMQAENKDRGMEICRQKEGSLSADSPDPCLFLTARPHINLTQHGRMQRKRMREWKK